ncbi:MAG: restriction endonuclease, partial [Chloroflexota bacterium]|nr:restriction endonuclease [Chloroflexota bacterium]
AYKTRRGGKGRTNKSQELLHRAFVREFMARQWQKCKVEWKLPEKFYIRGYEPSFGSESQVRQMDFVKNRVGTEIHFEKHKSVIYDVAAKMTIFHNLDIIDVGVEIVPVKDFADDMSTGVSYFEQFVWDLEHRGVSNIDIPILILGIAA